MDSATTIVGGLIGWNTKKTSTRLSSSKRSVLSSKIRGSVSVGSSTRKKGRLGTGSTSLGSLKSTKAKKPRNYSGPTEDGDVIHDWTVMKLEIGTIAEELAGIIVENLLRPRLTSLSMQERKSELRVNNAVFMR